MAPVFFSSKFLTKIIQKLPFSKTDGVFFLYTWWCVLPVFAVPQPQDPLLEDLKVRFITESRAFLLEDAESRKKYAFLIQGDALEQEYGLLSDPGEAYHSIKKEHQVGSLVLRSPEPGYLERKGLYQGYRLLFGSGYIVPSFLLKVTSQTSQEAHFLEVLPAFKDLKSLKDLSAYGENPSLGIHLLGQILFPAQHPDSQSYELMANGSHTEMRKHLSSRDRLEGEGAFSSYILFKNNSLPQSLKKQVRHLSVTHFIPSWLLSLHQAEESLHQMGFKEPLELKDTRLRTLAARLHKLKGVLNTPYDLTYEDLSTLMKPTPSSQRGGEESPLRSLEQITLISLYELFFKHQQKDWTETFEILGETFPTYASRLDLGNKNQHLFTNPSFLSQALEHNRSPAVLTFMRKAGLKDHDIPPSLLHTLVHLAGQKIDLDKAEEWIDTLTQAGLSLEHQDEQKNTPLDLALQQHKHTLVKALIEKGAGAKVKPHLILEYLNKLRSSQTSSQPSNSSRFTTISEKKDLQCESNASSPKTPLKTEEVSKELSVFERYLDLLEFRNHDLRWQLMLESLLPVYTNQEGLRFSTTDQERVLTPNFVQMLWKKGEAKKAKNFLSFTQTTDTDQRKYGRRTVGKITDGRYTLYVKQYPELPGIEEAVGFFTRQLLGYGAPHTLLANIHGTAYLFSEGIEGKPLQDYLTHQTSLPWSKVQEKLNAETLSGMILLAMLTNPEDGKPDNYILQPRLDGTYQIVGIDNDHSFVPTASTVKGKVKMNVKSILFALDEMKSPLHPKVKKTFLYQRPGDIIREWVGRLLTQADAYNQLFSPKEILNHFDKQNSFLGIALHPTIVEDLYKNLSSLQALIQDAEELTHLDLLRNFHRQIYLRYNQGFEELPEANPLERFKQVDGKEYKLHKKKGLQTLSTGKNLLSTNTMITSKKDLQEYVKKGRGREISLEKILETLKEIEERDTSLLAQQAMSAIGQTIPLDQMTDPQREDFFKRLDWSKLPIQNQQALLEQMAKESHGDPTLNKTPWRGKLTFKNCLGFTEGGLLSQSFSQKMNWTGITEVILHITSEGGEEALAKVSTLTKNLPEEVNLKLYIENLNITDEVLDKIVENKTVKTLRLKNCSNIEDPKLRQEVPSLTWKGWSNLNKKLRKKLRKFVLEDSQETELDLRSYKIGGEGLKVLLDVLKGRKLNKLELGRNKIENAGAKAIAAGLKNSQVQVLGLDRNEINEEGAKALAKGLKDSQMQVLDLEMNPIIIESGVAKTLIKELKDSKVTHFNLETCAIKDDLKKEINKIISKNKRRLKKAGLAIDLPTDKSEETKKNIEASNKNAHEKEDLSNSKNEQETIPLESLLASAGLTGEGEQQVFTSDLERAQFYFSQKEESLYPKALELLMSLLDQEEEGAYGFSGLDLDENLIKESPTDLEEASFRSHIKAVTPQEEALSLLKQLADVYPKATLTLAKVYAQGNNHPEAQTILLRTLKNQVSETLSYIEAQYQKTRKAEYAELMADNFLEGYVSPVNVQEGERWMRRALEANPTNTHLQTRLAHLLIDQGGLEEEKAYAEIQSLLDQAKEQNHIEAHSLSLMIEEMQAARKVKEVPLSLGDQKLNARQQRLLRALHQSQFNFSSSFDLKDLTKEQQEALQKIRDQRQTERDDLEAQLLQAEKDLTQASPLDRKAIEAEHLTLKQSLQALSQKHQAELKDILFPEGLKPAPILKQFYEDTRQSIRQQLSLLDAIEAGLASREESLMETHWKEAINKAVGYAGGMLISNIPIPANGLLASITQKAFEFGLDKLNEKLQGRITEHYDQQAQESREKLKQVTGGFENNALVSNSLSALYTYRLQNVLPSLTEKGAKTLSSRLSASLISYLQDEKRLSNPATLTQLATMSFYHHKCATVGDLIAKARKKEGLKMITGKVLSYKDLFKMPLIETTDGAQYSVHTETISNMEAPVQIVPLIERTILTNPQLQGKKGTLREVRMPQFSPMQVAILEEQDDMDYARKALEFVSELEG